jgi:putative endonuclease
MQKFLYVYMIESLSTQGRHYVGITENLKARLRKHNAGEVVYSSRHRPWRIKTVVAFTDENRALTFECYLKSASGRAFEKKHF